MQDFSAVLTDQHQLSRRAPASSPLRCPASVDCARQALRTACPRGPVSCCFASTTRWACKHVYVIAMRDRITTFIAAPAWPRAFDTGSDSDFSSSRGRTATELAIGAHLAHGCMTARVEKFAIPETIDAIQALTAWSVSAGDPIKPADLALGISLPLTWSGLLGPS